MLRFPGLWVRTIQNAAPEGSRTSSIEDIGLFENLITFGDVSVPGALLHRTLHQSRQC